MACNVCAAAPKFHCGNLCGTQYCHEKCAQQDWISHKSLCADLKWALIEGKKRPREEAQPVDPIDLNLIVFHTLKKTPEMLQNLANVLSIEQLRNLKYQKIFRESLWRNSNFWYYVVRRHRPELATGAFSNDVPYKQIAMKNIVAPDMTIRERGEMPALTQEALKAVMRNPVAVDILIKDVTLEEIINWSIVSKDFFRIVADSNIFWYKLYMEYVINIDIIDPDDESHPGYDYNPNLKYKNMLMNALPHLFDVVLIIDINDESDVVLNLPKREFTLGDVLLQGGAKAFVAGLDNLPLYNKSTGRDWKEDDGPLEVLIAVDDNDFESNTSDDFHLIIWDVLKQKARKFGRSADKQITKQMIKGTQFTIRYYVDVIEKEQLEVNLTYPEEIVPYYYDEAKRSWLSKHYDPLVRNKRNIREDIQTFDYYPSHPYFADVEMVDIELPAYFELRGRPGEPIDLEKWGEIFVNGEIVPFERLSEHVHAIFARAENVLIELKKH